LANPCILVWVKAIEAASEGNFGRIIIDYEQYFDLLGLNKDEELTTSAVNKAYRKLALKLHPDKGGDIMEFKKIQEASDALLNKLEEEEKELQYETHYIDACIVKVTIIILDIMFMRDFIRRS
jgi:preprotein translocase subunit Sec63